MTQQTLTRSARVAAIADTAAVRAALGQAARYRLGGDGRHVISIFDRAAGRLRVYSGPTLAAAIRRAEEEWDEEEQGEC